MRPELDALRTRWEETTSATDEWKSVRDELGEALFEKMSRLERWQARYMLAALRKSDDNQAAAWKLLIEEGYLPDKLGKNPSQSLSQKWKRLTKPR